MLWISSKQKEFKSQNIKRSDFTKNQPNFLQKYQKAVEIKNSVVLFITTESKYEWMNEWSVYLSL